MQIKIYDVFVGKWRYYNVTENKLIISYRYDGISRKYCDYYVECFFRVHRRNHVEFLRTQTKKIISLRIYREFSPGEPRNFFGECSNVPR